MDQICSRSHPTPVIVPSPLHLSCDRRQLLERQGRPAEPSTFIDHLS